MTWNWQQPDWPNFTYNSDLLSSYESSFLLSSDRLSSIWSHIERSPDPMPIVDLFTLEAMTTSKIEGEYLNRESVRSSFCRSFGLSSDSRFGSAEVAISALLTDAFTTWREPLDHNTMWRWHDKLFSGDRWIQNIGSWRTSEQPMRVVSGYEGRQKIHFEAPPASIMSSEMSTFIDWFNGESTSLPALTRAGLVHLYFVSIHPFDDGNGRIARALCEKSLSQSIGSILYISLSSSIMNDHKRYYSELDSNSKTMSVQSWLDWFSKTVLLSLEYSEALCSHILFKTRMLDRISDSINARQKKVILRMFSEGPEGFEGGLSADNYISIANTSPATARRDLGELVELGALTRTGERKSTRYWLNRDEPSILPIN